MRVLITGASGLIGTALTAALRARGDEAVALRRPAHWDPGAGFIDRDAVAGHDAVVHLAGESIGARRWTPEQKARIIDSRRVGTALLAEALATLPDGDRPAVLVSASGINYYGDRGD